MPLTIAIGVFLDGNNNMTSHDVQNGADAWDVYWHSKRVK